MVGPREICDMEAFGGTIRDSIDTTFRDLIGDSVTPNVPVLHRYSHYAALSQSWAASPRTTRRLKPDLPAPILRKHHLEAAPIKINATLPEKGRDLQLALFR